MCKYLRKKKSRTTAAMTKTNTSATEAITVLDESPPPFGTGAAATGAGVVAEMETMHKFHYIHVKTSVERTNS